MRRIKMVLAAAAVMAMLLALTAGPVGAQNLLGDIPPPGPEIPGQAQFHQPENRATPTPTLPGGQNCIGVVSSNPFKGPGGNPGGAALPTTFNNEPSFNGPVTRLLGQAAPSEFGFTSTKPNAISAFQEFVRNELC